jgi:pilus assembly protein Flp/PilA
VQALLIWIQFRLALRDERGATAVEYGLIVSLIAVVLIGVLGVLGGNLEDRFSDIADAIAP